MKKSEAESHLLKLEKFNQKNLAIQENLTQISEKNKQIEKSAAEMDL